MNVLLLLAHSIEEHDQIQLLSELGYDVFSLGGYIDPAHPHDPKRPALPDAPFHPDLKAVVDELGTDDNLTAAKEHIPDAILAWADVIICHHYLDRWVIPEWPRLRDKRVIWRTVGQSDAYLEQRMAPLRADGLQIVRYSPKERNLPNFAGEDDLIRFWKDPDEWSGWTGEEERVINVTQHLFQRGDFTNYGFWEAATQGLPRMALGPGSEAIGGPGELSYPMMQDALRRSRAYLYTGTQPASYTLGLIEALMTGIPVVSIGADWMRVFPYSPSLFEGDELALFSTNTYHGPELARSTLRHFLDDWQAARTGSVAQREKAISLFGKARIAHQWAMFLGARVPVAA